VQGGRANGPGEGVPGLVTNIEDFPDDLEIDEVVELEPSLARRIEVTLDETADGQRLDRALADAVPALSRVRIQAMLAEGRVTRDGVPIDNASAKARTGQHIVIDIPPPVAAIPQPQHIPLTIAFEDDEMLVIDKPAGLVVHPGAGNPDGTLVNALLAYCGDRLSGIGGVRRPGIVHRLDKDTSGLMVVAKTDRAHVALSAQLQSRTLKRIYTAVVWGNPMYPPDPRPHGPYRAPPGRRPSLWAEAPAEGCAGAGKIAAEASITCNPGNLFAPGDEYGDVLQFARGQ